MRNLLEVSGEEIERLNDSDLRELIGLLCEADCRANNISPKGVLWSGHQDANDNGLDVVVEINLDLNGFIPKSNTGFQVKKSNISASEIIKEMKPNGVLRDSIKSIIANGGSYIIVSSGANMTTPKLKSRLEAMKKAVIDENNCENIHLDFYDRGRIATWVRTHPSLILWVRNRIGFNLTGWQSYGNWTRPNEILEEYIFDNCIRLFDSTSNERNELSTEKGLDKIRSILLANGSCIRLTGLSGVGKTRFVQAIFDEKVGENPLNPSLAFYTDISYSPNPDPRTFANHLIAQKTRAILIVDNCPPALHRQLTEVCSGSKSSLSSITVEYDVRDDLPEETHVFRLEPASEDLIFELIRKKYKHLNQIDARTIANFSGGNARVAIALANTVRQGETLSGFQDEQLFERLFFQRNEVDHKLMASAQVISLVYSFDGENIEDNKSELSILGSLINNSADDLYRAVGQLKERDLIQSRGLWRAILPHAIANRLAKKAFEVIHPNKIVSTFLNCGNERLLKSFTRRLNFLHDCKAAVEIANTWLTQGGLLENIENLNHVGINIFENIVPLSPHKILESIEHAATKLDFTSRRNKHHGRYIRILRSIAFDKDLFLRSTKIICQFAILENVTERNNSSRNVLKSLFHIYLSGTHATAETRYLVIHELISSQDESRQDLGILLLGAALEAWHFTSQYDFTFGARPRDFGFSPKNREDIITWFKFFIDKSVSFILVNNHISTKVKTVLSQKFRGLWTKGQMYTEFEDAAQKIKDSTSWNEGWVEVRKTIYFDSSSFDKDTSERLHKLSDLLKPINLIERVKTYAFGQPFDIAEAIEDIDSRPIFRFRKAEEITIKLGMQLSQDNKAFNGLLPDLVSTAGFGLVSLGRGLAKGCNNKNALWTDLRNQIATVNEEKQNISVLRGFLLESSLNDSEFSDYILDEILIDAVLSKWFLHFQTIVEIDKKGIARIHKSLDDNIAPISSYFYLGIGQAHTTINDYDLANLLLKILSKQNGDRVALDILVMRFHGNETRNYSMVLISAGQNILKNFKLNHSLGDKDIIDYNLSTVADICLSGHDAFASTVEICSNFIDYMASNKLLYFEYTEFLAKIAQKQPPAFLNILIDPGTIKNFQFRDVYSSDNNLGNPIDSIPHNELISWCEVEPSTRYTLIISLTSPFIIKNGSNTLEWKPIINKILDLAPEKKAILKQLEFSIRPTSWQGPYSETLASRLTPLELWFNHNNSQVVTWAKQTHTNLQDLIIKERETEDYLNKQKFESFE
jgi:hypothetical protein